MADEDQEKTEEASQSRREEYRKRGEVAQTKELASTLFLLFSAGAIFALGKFFFSQLYEVFTQSFGVDMVQAVRSGEILASLKMAGMKIFILIAPVALIALIISVGSTVVQVGFLQVEDAFAPNFEKINPLSGLKRMFALKNLIETIKSVVKILFIGAIVVLILKKEIFRVPFMIQLSVQELVTYMGDVTVRLLGGIGVAMGVLSAADYFFQKWDLDKKMMMTKQEVKEEHKSREGDPMIKARIRRVQREMANRRMMDKVPKADVIITNPTHIAIALKYDANLPAPQVIAKGADLIAEKIKELAREHNIPVVENKPLARTIYKTLKIGQVIPRELFVAVAEVLSYVYRLRKKKVRK